ncbi:hypothetical protein [Sansalvadorimonas verongulae]|uniref:hypothetical protein n=1 Tax=Sansalvadorimonas verongulae TaxID=2172824 RepID=UPI0012BCBA2A|nr:hypothetical protein [Sansalvadorimonas verongulae]MTI13821.1 hypothetical protein [Sansalvadorimonas verongulae]
MITDINRTSVKSELNKESLADYWEGYFHYKENSPELYQIAQGGLVAKVEEIRKEKRPFVDSQRVIGRLLTELGSSHNFHRQFREQLPDFHPNQILGMHLYDIMIQNTDTWTYIETKPSKHVYPHATYFKPDRK